MLICPKCKLLYEKSTHCIRCGSPLVEKTSSEKEETTPPPQPEINKETPPIQKPKDRKEESSSTHLFDFEEKFPPAPKPKVKKTETKAESVSDMKKALHEVQRDEQTSSDISPSETKKEVSRSEKIEIRIPTLTRQNISLIILILIGGYLLWSIYSHFTPKKPNANVPPSKESSNLLHLQPTPPTKPPAPVIKPEVADDKKLDKKPSISEKETGVSPPPPSPPIVSKNSLSDEKEIEHIKKLLENIREGNLKKNIDLFMSCYSAGFKDREKKKRETLNVWGNFIYIDLTYNLREHSISGDTARIKVEWLIQFYTKTNGHPQESKAVLDVNLNRETDGWKIKNIKTVS